MSSSTKILNFVDEETYSRSREYQWVKNGDVNPGVWALSHLAVLLCARLRKMFPLSTRMRGLELR